MRRKVLGRHPFVQRLSCKSRAKASVCKRRHDWNDAVSKGSESVHPRGSPMRSSTKRGFKRGVPSEKFAPGVEIAGAGGKDWQAGHSRAVAAKSSPPDPRFFRLALASRPPVGTLGVGQNRACRSSPGSSLRSPPRDRKESEAGVCQLMTCLANSPPPPAVLPRLSVF